MTTESIRVLIVDDAPMWREALRTGLQREPDIVVEGEAADGVRAVELAIQLLPDVVLMDLSMPRMGGIEATTRILAANPSARVLVLTQAQADEDVVGALRAGAVGYLLKSVGPEELAEFVRRVSRGEIVFTPKLAGLVLAELRNPTRERPAPVLTDREQDVLKAVAQGLGPIQIAERFDLSAGGVRNELRNVTHKLRLQVQPKIAGGRTLPGPTFHDPVRRSTGEPPPIPHPISFFARVWLALVVLLVVAALLGLGAAGGVLSRINETTLRHVQGLGGHAVGQTMRAIRLLGSAWTIGVVRGATLLALIIYKRWQHLLAFLASTLVVTWFVSVTTTGTTPVAGILPPAALSGQLAPSSPVAGLTVSFLSIAYGLATPGRVRRVVFIAAGGLVGVLGLAELQLGLASPSGVAAGVVIGTAVPLLAFGLIAPEGVFPLTYRRVKRAWLSIDETRKQAIVNAIQAQLGMTVLEVKPFLSESAAGSTPLKIRVKGEPDVDLFGKLYALSHVRSDRLYKLGRMIRYGSLEDEKPYNSVRRLAEYEDYILRYMDDAGIRTAEPYGVVELTPEREYILVTEFIEGAREILDPAARLDQLATSNALSIVRRLWDAGLAHRDIKPSNLLVNDDGVYLIDAAFCQVRPSPWRQAVDLANMMLVLGLRVDPEIVYKEARELFEEAEIAEAFAATHSVTMPAQLRSEIEKQGRQLTDAFRRLAPERKPIPIQRWSVRRIAVTAGAAAVLGVSAALVWSNLHAIGLR